MFSLTQFFVNNENELYPRGLSSKLQIQLANESILERIEVDDSLPPIAFNFISLIDVQATDKGEPVGNIPIFAL